MATTKQVNIRDRTYCFYDDLINLKGFDPSLLKVDKKSFNDISMHYIGTVTKKPEYNINNVSQLYLLIGEKGSSKYLNIFLTEISNEVLKKYAEDWSGIKDQIKKINNNQIGEYGKYYMKIKFNSNDDLPLNKMLKVPYIDNYYQNYF